MADALHATFRALADGTRRRLLDMLRDQPRTTGELCAGFPGLSRFAVMKHLKILHRAGLVLSRRQGRQRVHHLNAVPIRQIYERWVSRYADAWATSLVSLQRSLETGNDPQRRSPRRRAAARSTRSRRAES